MYAIRSYYAAELVADAVGFPVEGIVETEKVKAMTPAEEARNNFV